MKLNEFEKEEKYKLYRTVREILHPTISKRNISNYKIIVGEEYIPLRVYYPKKVSNITRIMIYIHGNSKITLCEEKYSEISQRLAKDLDTLVISVDYDEREKDINKTFNDIYETIKYVYEGLLRVEVLRENITIAGDSNGASIILGIIDRLTNELKVEKLILFYPVLSGEYFKETKYKSIKEDSALNNGLIKRLKSFYKDKVFPETEEKLFHLKSKDHHEYPKTLVLSGNTDVLKDESQDFSTKSSNITLSIIPFADHGFLNTKDKEIIREYNNSIKSFLESESNE